MAGAAYLRARALLQEQAVAQSQNLLTTQIEIIDREITNKEAHLKRLLESGDFTILTELALHANPKSSEFREIRNSIIKKFNDLSSQEDAPSFNQFLLLDPNGNVKIASNAAWQGLKLDPSVFEQTLAEHPSIALYGLSPLYENEFILVTAQQYKTARGSVLGSLVGITEKKSLQKLTQPLNGLSPLATTYFVLSDGRFIHSDPDTGLFAPVESASQENISAIFTELMSQQSPPPRTLDITSPEGEAALAQLKWFPKMQAGVVLQVKASDVYGQIASLIPFTSLLTLVTLLAMGLVLILGINRVVKPLRALSEITRGFADGDWSRRAEVTSNNEIGVLASSFNQMADDLGKLYRSLEQKVDEGERHIRTTAEVAQNIKTSSDLNETFAKTVELLVKQFGFHQASIFLLD
jgi:HAMP domain-containing protein